MNDILHKICERKIIEIEESKKKCSLETLKKIIPNKKNRSFQNLLSNSQKYKKNNIIAEIKKSSPSAGLIIKDYEPENIALNYEKAGAGAISILTEISFFDGHLDHMSMISKCTKLPILRKDFILDPYQILESKAYNADAILLIASILNDNQIKDFINISKEYGLDCLLEVHNEKELERVINIDHHLIGINNRNLKDLSVNISNTINLVTKIPKDFIIVAESGIKSNQDIKRYNEIGIFNFLIGETILKSINIDQKIKELLN